MDDEYALGAWRQERQQKGMDITISVEISRQEYESYLDAISAYRSLTERATYQLLVQNYLKLGAILETYTNLEKVGGSFRHVDMRNMNVTFMGALTNWLGTTRLYLESERDFLLRQFGGESAELQRYKDAAAFAFDSHEGYRFLYNLRDYAQHCGPPLSGMTVFALDGKRVVDFYLSGPELLAARFGWSRHAKHLIQQWPDQISIMPLVDDAMAGYRHVEDENLKTLLERCGDTVGAMRDGIARIGSTDGHPAIFLTPGPGEKGRMAWQSFPESSALDRIERVLATDDPLAHARKAPAERPPRTPELRHADAQAAAVIATWLEYGNGPRLMSLINHIATEDQGFDPLIGGLVNLSAYQLKMLEAVLGVSPEALLGSITADDSD
jgi:hypothetical protein